MKKALFAILFALSFPVLSAVLPLAVVDGHRFYYDDETTVNATDDGVIVTAIVVTDDKAFNLPKAENFQLFAVEMSVNCRSHVWVVNKIAIFATDGSLLGRKVFEEKDKAWTKADKHTLPDFLIIRACPKEV